MRHLLMVAAAIAVSSGAALAQNAGDPAAGENVFRQCLPCHAIGPGAGTKVGPELNGLDGRKAASVADYPYSDAMKNSGITWNEQSFKEYIKDPKAKVPKTKMIFTGLKKPKEVDDIWAYLKQFNADGSKK